LFGSKRREWARSEIRTVMVGASGMEVNDTPVLELQIQGQSEKLLGFLSGRDERELAWMATVLRHTLNASAPSATDAPVEPGAEPPDSNLARRAAGPSGERALALGPEFEDEVENLGADKPPRSMALRLAMPLIAVGAIIWGGLF